MSEDYPHAFPSHDALETVKAQFAACTAQLAALAGQMTWLMHHAQHDHDRRAYDPSGRGDACPAPPPRYDDPTRWYARRTTLVAAVQWHGWDHGPHDLGIARIPVHTPQDREYGWLFHGTAQPGGMAVAPGDWLVLTLDGDRTVVSAALFAATYAQVQP